MRGNHLKPGRIICGIIVFIFIFFGTGVAEMLSVGVPVANIRSGPGSSTDILWKVEKFHPLNIIEKKGTWRRFKDFEADEGWIHSSLIKNIPTVITKLDNCNVRSGADTKNAILFTVEKGIPFKVLKRQGKWIRIQHADGDNGWIHRSLVWP